MRLPPRHPTAPRRAPLRALRAALPAALSLLWLLPASPAMALTRGTGPEGVEWQSGGIGDEEIAALRAQFPKYDLWITTAARKSGAYLAGVHVHVRDEKGAIVLNLDMDGPWLLVKLPPGKYEVEATLLSTETGRMEVKRASPEISGHGLRQVILYFGTGDEVSPEHVDPPVSPYDSGAVKKP